MFRSVNARKIANAIVKQQRVSFQQQARTVGVRNIHNSSPLLNKKDEEELGPSLVEQYKLTDPSRYVPLTAVGLGLSSAIGLYHFDAESQLLALWVLFCGTVYSRGGPVIAEYFDETINQIEKEHKELEAAEIEAVKLTAEAHQRQTAIYKDISDLFDAQNEVMEGIVGSAKNRLAHQIRADVVKKLDTILSMENQAAESTRKHLVEKATSTVQAQFASGDQLKKSALDNALKALENPEAAKPDTTVGDLYTKFFADVESTVKGAAGKEFELSAEEAKDIQDVCESIARREGIEGVDVSVGTKVVFNA